MGAQFKRVSKRLGHSSYVLTLTRYADYIPRGRDRNPTARTGGVRRPYDERRIVAVRAGPLIRRLG